MDIIIDDKRYPCTVETSKTQMGKELVRIISEIAPVATDGFILDNGEDTFDRTAFKYLYREEGSIREYTTEPEEAISTELFYMGDQPESIYSVLSRQISAVANQVSVITPYEESKTAYIDDTEVIFDIMKQGNISVFMTDDEGQNVPFTSEQINGQLIVSFDKRETLATVTISIQ